MSLTESHLPAAHRGGLHLGSGPAAQTALLCGRRNLYPGCGQSEAGGEHCSLGPPTYRPAHFRPGPPCQAGSRDPSVLEGQPSKSGMANGQLSCNRRPLVEVA